MKIIGNIHSDIGIKKNVNQDAACLRVMETFLGQTALAVVCDGMGGLSEGEVASSSVVYAFSDWFENELENILKSGINFDVIKEKWLEIIEDQNHKLYIYGKDRNLKVGTTLAVILIIGQVYYIANVGDSRIYQIDETLTQLTMDQTVVNKAVLEGKLSPLEAKNHPKAHVLSQCIGVTDDVSPDFYQGVFKHETIYMICSDGFAHVLTDDEIHQGLSPSQIDDVKTAKIQEYHLVEAIKSRGEQDNITVVVLKGTMNSKEASSIKTKPLVEEENELNVYVVNSDRKL